MGNLNLFKYLVSLLLINWLNIIAVEGIVGGFEPRKNQFKYTVSLQANGIHIGGGAILDSVHVVTAARFFLDIGQNFINTEYSIVGGIVNTVEKNKQKIKINVASVFIPKLYRKFKDESYFSRANIDEASSHDIAILRLEKPMTLGPSASVDAVSLPNENYEGDESPEEFIISGFGYTTRLISTLTTASIHDWVDRSDIEPCKNCYEMKYTYATAISNDDCSNLLHSSIVTNSQMCARVDQKSYDNSLEGLCKGDVGNPLVKKKLNVIVGVHVFGQKDCNEKDKAGVYTKITDHLEFIRNVLNNNLPNANARAAHYELKNKIFGKNIKVLVEDKFVEIKKPT